jgi:hypothetical protein
LQVLTIEQLLDGAEVKMPDSSMTFKEAEREKNPAGEENKLF